MGITDRRLQQLAKEGLPKLRHGLYPLAGSVQWYIKYWEDRALGREGDAAKKTKQDLENALLQTKVEEATGHLVNRVEMVQIISAGFLRLGKWLDGIPSFLGRKHNLSTDVIRSMREHLDEGRANFVRDCREFIDVVEPPDAKSKPKRT